MKSLGKRSAIVTRPSLDCNIKLFNSGLLCGSALAAGNAVVLGGKGGGVDTTFQGERTKQ